jgi:hypothetical protein
MANYTIKMKKDSRNRNNYHIYDSTGQIIVNEILENGRKASDLLTDYAMQVDLFITKNKIKSAKLEIEVLKE